MTAVGAYVATDESTTGTSYGDLATTTDSVTVDVPASGMVLVSTQAGVSNTGGYSHSWASYALSGNNTRSANDNTALQHTQQSNESYLGAVILETGLTSGSTTFKMKYRVDGNTGHWYRRRIAVWPVTNEDAVAAYVATDESTTSTSYTDLTTTTDQVTTDIPASGMALVGIHSCMGHNNVWPCGYVSYALSGNNTRSADDVRSLRMFTSPYTRGAASVMFLETGLTSGSTTFKMKYKTDNYTLNCNYRRIFVIPLP